jgi:hypothetical protein
MALVTNRQVGAPGAVVLHIPRGADVKLAGQSRYRLHTEGQAQSPRPLQSFGVWQCTSIGGKGGGTGFMVLTGTWQARMSHRVKSQRAYGG